MKIQQMVLAAVCGLDHWKRSPYPVASSLFRQPYPLSHNAVKFHSVIREKKGEVKTHVSFPTQLNLTGNYKNFNKYGGFRIESSFIPFATSSPINSPVQFQSVLSLSIRQTGKSNKKKKEEPAPVQPKWQAFS